MHLASNADDVVELTRHVREWRRIILSFLKSPFGQVGLDSASTVGRRTAGRLMGGLLLQLYRHLHRRVSAESGRLQRSSCWAPRHRRRRRLSSSSFLHSSTHHSQSMPVICRQPCIIPPASAVFRLNSVQFMLKYINLYLTRTLWSVFKTAQCHPEDNTNILSIQPDDSGEFAYFSTQFSVSMPQKINISQKRKRIKIEKELSTDALKIKHRGK